MNEIIVERNVNQEAIKSLKEMTLKYIEAIEKLKVQIKEGNQMIKDSMVNDAVYLDTSEKHKELQKALTVEKKRIQARPEVLEVSLKVKSLRGELKETKSSLSDYLIEYERLTGANVIETPHGEQLSIFKKAEVLKIPGRSGGE